MPKKQEIFHQRQKWKIASTEDMFRYKTNLNSLLGENQYSCADCNNIRCRNQDHIEALDSYIFEINKAIEKSSAENIPFINCKIVVNKSG